MFGLGFKLGLVSHGSFDHRYRKKTTEFCGDGPVLSKTKTCSSEANSKDIPSLVGDVLCSNPVPPPALRSRPTGKHTWTSVTKTLIVTVIAR